jgi:hypothetical protein
VGGRGGDGDGKKKKEGRVRKKGVGMDFEKKRKARSQGEVRVPEVELFFFLKANVFPREIIYVIATVQKSQKKSRKGLSRIETQLEKGEFS